MNRWRPSATEHKIAVCGAVLLFYGVGMTILTLAAPPHTLGFLPAVLFGYIALGGVAVLVYWLRWHALERRRLKYRATLRSKRDMIA